jgi:hypothetical protein
VVVAKFSTGCARFSYPEKAKTVVELKVWSGPRTVDGNDGSFGESGKCWVSKRLLGPLDVHLPELRAHGGLPFVG